MNPTIHQAAESLSKLLRTTLGDLDTITIGIADTTLHVYVHQRKHLNTVRSHLAAGVYAGYTVQIEYIGRIRPCSANKQS